MDTRELNSVLYVLAESLDDAEEKIKDESDYFVSTDKYTINERAQQYSHCRVFTAERTLKITG